MANRPDDVEGEASHAPTLTVAAVARRLGVAPATLRTWARRYGLGPSAHTAGAHRRYSAEDLGRLVVMRRLTHEGVSPADAARMALAGDTADAVPRQTGRVIDLVPADPSASPAHDHATSRSGGGRVLPLPDATPAVRGLARAAMALDAGALTESFQRYLERLSVLEVWERLMVPLLRGVGDRWASTGEGIEVEHLLSESILGVLRAHGARGRDARHSAPVLLACLDDEQHGLSLHVVATALAERGVDVRMLGTRTPLTALEAAVRRCGPAVVIVWATVPGLSTDALSRLRGIRPSPLVLAGGPGWPPATGGPTSRQVTVQQAVDATLSAVL
ncbi:MAG TPA: MerR family transcriptional regulator [Actinomycetales bacterium]|nr:MerR family transcriptional regulator [Actinomycetales bacterium]